MRRSAACEMCIRDRAGDGPQGHRFFHAAAVHLCQSGSDAPGAVGLQMDTDQVRAGPDKILDVAHGLFDHQVDVQEHVCVPVHCLTDGEAEGNVGDKSAVHHVKMDHVSAFNGI